jgi:hypothetical protein
MRIKIICIVEIIEDTIPERPEEEEAGPNTEALIDQVEKEVDDDFARLEEDIVQEAEKREGANKENMEGKENKDDIEETEDVAKDKEEQDEGANNKHAEQIEDQENAARDPKKDDSSMGENPGKTEEENNNNKDDTFLLTGSHIVDNVSSNLKNDVDQNGNMEQFVQ